MASATSGRVQKMTTCENIGRDSEKEVQRGGKQGRRARGKAAGVGPGSGLFSSMTKGFEINGRTPV